MAKRRTHGGRRAGAGRKPKHGEGTVARGLRVPESLDAKIAALADDAGVRWSEMAVDLMTRAVRYKR